MGDETALVAQQDAGFLRMVVDPRQISARYEEVQQFLRQHLVEGRDYGKVPGVDKPFLWKPGAENLCLVYGLRPEYEVTMAHDFTLKPPYLSYSVVCRLYKKGTTIEIGQGVGGANSWEVKYRYRTQKQLCPTCGAEAIFKSKPPQTGYYCWQKRGGCGARFSAGDPAIEGQQIGRVENEDVADLGNTLEQMAAKRAFVSATKTATATSGLFTQTGPTGRGFEEDDYIEGSARTLPVEPDTSPGPAPTMPAAAPGSPPAPMGVPTCPTHGEEVKQSKTGKWGHELGEGWCVIDSPVYV